MKKLYIKKEILLMYEKEVLDEKIIVETVKKLFNPTIAGISEANKISAPRKVQYYKGWEIAKMISEGTLRPGDKVSAGMIGVFKIVKSHIEVDNTNSPLKNKELGNSVFTQEECLFEIIKQSVTFDDVLKSDKKCRVEHESIKVDTMLDTYKDFNTVMAILSSWYSEEKLKSIIREGRWYLE
jgi:hypothetical protein